jgi:hypothetical protein
MTMKNKEQYLAEYAEKIAKYEALIAEAQKHYNANDFAAGHISGSKADRILDFGIIDPIAAEWEREGWGLPDLATFAADIKRQALIKALEATGQPIPYMLQPKQAASADIYTDGELDVQKVIRMFEGPDSDEE